MKLVMEGSPEEIAALVLAAQERRTDEILLEKIKEAVAALFAG